MAIDPVNDTVYGTAKDEGWGGFFHVFAGGGDDFIGGPSRNDPRTPSDGRVEGYGQAGSDTIYSLYFNVGVESFAYGGAGIDSIFSAGGDVRGGGGNDVIENTRDDAGIPNATLRGGAGGDFLKTTITAGNTRGVDILRGGDGDDALLFDVAPGSARVRLHGGDGADDFQGRGEAVVLDFDFEEGDRIILSQIARNNLNRIDQQVIETERGTALRVSFPAGGEVETVLTLIGIDQILDDAAFR